MAFGKRGVSELDRPIDGHRSTGNVDWSLSRRDIGLALGTAMAVFTGVILFAGDAVQAFRPAHVDAPLVDAFAYQPAQFDQSYGQAHFAANNPASMALVMSTTPEGLDAIDRELQERCLKRLNGNAARYAEENGMVPLHTQTGARFVVCSLQIFKGRLCEAPYRSRIVAQLEEFVRAQRAVSNPGRQGEGSESVGADPVVAKSARSPAQVVPPILAEQLRAFSEVSLISRVDFQNDAPEELKPYLAAETGPSPCV